MHLHDLMGWAGPMTHRQYLLWLAFLEAEQYRHTLTEEYLARLCYYTFLPHAKHPRRLDAGKFRLTPAGKPRAPLTAEESKRRWLGHVAAGGGIRTPEEAYGGDRPRD